MKEVSCKIVLLIFAEFRRQGLPIEPLVEGVGYPLSYLQDKHERIDWSTYCRLVENAGRYWTLEDWERCGAALPTSPLWRSVGIVARLLVTPKELARFLARETEGPGHETFTCVVPKLEETGPRRLRLDLRLKPGYEMCEAFFWATKGSMTMGPRLLGLPPATVRMTSVERGAIYDIAFPAGGGLLRSAARAITWPFTARAAARELYETHEVLLLRYQELDEARGKLEATHAQLVQAGKLAALGLIGAGIAHELNQPIQAIRGFAQRLRRHREDKIADHADELDQIVDATGRMARIVEGIRLFCREVPPDFGPVAPLAPIEAALGLVGRQLEREGIGVAYPQLDGPLPEIRGDPVQLEQVFVNLLLNARDALVGSPAAEDSDDGEPAPRTITLGARVEQQHVVLSVQDSGPGVPPGSEDRIFDPFFTTKVASGGTGLGLSLSHGIVKQHGGDLRHERLSGGGARFVVRLPLNRVQATAGDPRC